MKNKIIFTIIIFVVIAHSSFCQSNLRKGFIITLENDTIKGQIDNRSNSKNYKSCIFKGGQEKREYYPDEIHGFGYDNDKFFSSKILKDSFVEVLVTGEISLYKSKDKYHIKKDTSIYELESNYQEVEIDGIVSKRQNNRWRGIVSYMISDCINKANSIVSRLRLDEKSLTKLIVKYNNCKGSDYVEFKANKPWIKYDYGVSVGVMRSEIQISNIPQSVSYLVDSYSSIDPTVGVILGISSPRISESVAFQGEIHYSKSNYSSLVVLNNSSTQYHDVYIDLNKLSVPLSLKYSFPEKKYGWYLQGGINYEYHINSESNLRTEIVSGNVVNTSSESPAFEIKDNQIGYWGGFGILRSFKKCKASLTVRYYRMPTLNKLGDIRVNTNGIALHLILFKK